MNLIDVFNQIRNGEVVDVTSIPSEDREQHIEELVTMLVSDKKLKKLRILSYTEPALKRLLRSEDYTLRTCAAYTLMHIWFPPLELIRYA